MKYTLNAENKKMGRLATEVAVLLMGKNIPDFAKNKIPNIQVEVTNISKLDITTKKKEQTLYKRYSGYPGGLKIETFDKLSKRLGFGDAFRKTVSGMLPKNKLRDKMLKNLVITE
jgi:large subunit ribosomal protein L13